MKPDYPLPYRRSYHRFILDASASLIIDKNTEEPSILRDLCPRGSGVVTHYSLKENQQVTIIIKIPNLLLNRFLPLIYVSHARIHPLTFL